MQPQTQIARAALAVLLMLPGVARAELQQGLDRAGRPVLTNAEAQAGNETLSVSYASPSRVPAERRLAYAHMIRDSATRHGLRPRLLEAMIAVESGFRPDAVSKKGAQGLMQLMPETARELGVADPFDPQANIEGGARYMRLQLDRFGQRLSWALAAYNAGPGAVERAQGIPRIPETVDYVRKVHSELGIVGLGNVGSGARALTVRRGRNGAVHLTNVGATQSSLRLLSTGRTVPTLTNR